MNSSSQNAIRKPFIEHIYELRRRLLICAAFIAVGGGIGYSLNETLSQLIQRPLGEKLYYTSPTGGFNFIFVLCLSFGLIVALPCIIYQVLAFLRPILPKTGRFVLLGYAACSVLLAAIGISFAYFISLPAALHFLTNIGGASDIESLITTDSYFRFALAYLIGFAVLFQLPLILVILNRITPLKPGKLMKGQRYVLLGSFVIAAILTPTPDPFNQTLMAGPIIILYQLSIVLVWMINSKHRRAERRAAAVPQRVSRPLSELPAYQPVRAPSVSPASFAPTATAPVLAAQTAARRPMLLSDITPSTAPRPTPAGRGRLISDFGPARHRQPRPAQARPTEQYSSAPARQQQAPQTVVRTATAAPQPVRHQWAGGFSDVLPASQV